MRSSEREEREERVERGKRIKSELNKKKDIKINEQLTQEKSIYRKCRYLRSRRKRS